MEKSFPGMQKIGPPDRIIVLTDKRKETIQDVHRKLKGAYLQMTALMDDLDILMRT